MARLRGPDGCPWDREQTHQTLCEPLIDETAELLDTIDRNDLEHMCEELGDVLLQVVFHAQLADERGEFNFDDVARGINDKLVRRHPHVFGDIDLQDSEAVLHQWEQIKAAEKKRLMGTYLSVNMNVSVTPTAWSERRMIFRMVLESSATRTRALMSMPLA